MDCSRCKEEMNMKSSFNNELQELYQELIDAWNRRDAQGMAELFAEHGVQIGFDGSMSIGQEEILSHLKPIFADHPTAPFVVKVKDIRPLGADAAILHAIEGMIPPGKSDIEPSVNAHQTLVGNGWYIELFQNTPAQFHGRPQLVEEMTEELRQLL